MKKTYVYSNERGLRVLKDASLFEQYKAKYPSAQIVKRPSDKTLQKWALNGIARAIDGCKVEPDGECQHGYPSWLIALGYL